jgi:REP element-mobilizing transposase RayT
MSRISRKHVVEAGGTYHVYARGNGKMEIFKDRMDYLAYMRRLRELTVAHAVTLHCYTLMPNHVHLLLRTEGEALSACMKGLQQGYSGHFRRKYDFVGHVWQGRYQCKAIQDDAYFDACSTYIQQNPVRAGLVVDAEAWPYSSAGTLRGHSGDRPQTKEGC